MGFQAALTNKENAGLKLCFGHSGGEAFWFSEPTNDVYMQTNLPLGNAWQFGEQIVELCLTYSNIYCEVGYLDKILDPKKVNVLVRRLQAEVDRPSKGGTWKFGDKLMYSMYWHMIYKEPHYQDYLMKWDGVIKQMTNTQWRQAFFAGNAKKFPQLDELANDSRLTNAQRTKLRELSAAIK